MRRGDIRGGATQALQDQLPKIKYFHIGFLMQKNSKYYKKLKLQCFIEYRPSKKVVVHFCLAQSALL